MIAFFLFQYQLIFIQILVASQQLCYLVQSSPLSYVTTFCSLQSARDLIPRLADLCLALQV